MPRLPVLRPNQVIRAGFAQMLRRGNLSVTVPIHPGDLPPTVLHSILRQAQMDDDEFLAML